MGLATNVFFFFCVKGLENKMLKMSYCFIPLNLTNVNDNEHFFLLSIYPMVTE